VLALFRRMSKAQFQLVYDGPALRSGSMDVNELASSLLAVGDLLREANQQLNGDRRELSVKVKADFKRSSFEVALVVDQSLLEHAKSLLLPAGVTAAGLLALLFGTEAGKAGAAGVAASVLDLWKRLKGEKPKNTIQDTARNITIYQFGDGQINVDAKIAALYADEKIRTSITGTVRPVARPGIKSMEIRKGNKVIDRVSKGDLPPINEAMLDTAANSAQVLTDRREAMLRVVRLNFETGKWGFSDGGAHFGAELTDREFKQQLDDGIVGFYKGDTLRVILKTTQTVVSAREPLKTVYEIEKVIEHIHALRQQGLPLG
jgi:hypothetical protein